MQFINTDGMAFIGPGSEWFWAAISGLILVVTFIAVYRQLRIMRSAGALDQLESFEAELNSERMCRFELALLVALRDGADSLHLPRGAAAGVWRFWEKTGALARHGHLDPELLWEGSGTNVFGWWAVIGPYARQWRSDKQQPTFLENFEWLATAMAKIDRRALSVRGAMVGSGPGHEFDSHEALVFACEQRQDRLRIEEELRAIPAAPLPASAPASRRRRTG
ncbi:MAG TPA: hypothetical protein VFI15_08635 [Candidatus Limnocylindrales bacterium]|nr:hypothetical protein [Candidatus Limnocylindrales bacterium]